MGCVSGDCSLEECPDCSEECEQDETPRAVALLNEVLSGFGESSLVGSSWLPVDDPSGACSDSGALFSFVSLRDPFAGDKIAALEAAGVAPCVSVNGPLGALAEEFGWVEALTMTEIRGGETAFAAAAEKCLADVFLAGSLGARCIVVGDDLAGGSHPLVSPHFVRRVLIPTYSRMAENAQSMGLPAVFHSDGDVTGFYEDLAEAGFSGVHVAVGHDLGEVERAFGQAYEAELVPVGGVPAALLSDADESTVTRLVEFLGRLMDSGVCLISDDGGIATASDLETLSRIYSGV